MTQSFDSQVRTSFSFLESEHAMTFSGTKEIDRNDPRETALVARYRTNNLKIDIAWSDPQKSVNILIHIANADIPRRFRFLYLDSFIEFSSAGTEKCVVPQIFPRMSESGIFKAIAEREKLFESMTISDVLCLLAKKLRLHFQEIESPAPDKVLRYHEWMTQKRPALD